MTRLQQSPIPENSPAVPSDAQHDPDARTGRLLILGGRVQGLGIRPAVFHLATDLGLAGSVRNTPRGVEVELEGTTEGLRQFEIRLPDAMPAGAVLTRLLSEPLQPTGRDEFTIVKQPVDGLLTARVPEDRAVCPDCLREINAPTDRRHGYAFTSCTQCGPRYTVIRTMPFEREETSMVEFPLCEDCEQEYRRPRDRRFHAQTTACPACGPHLWFRTADDAPKPQGEQAVAAAVSELAAGRIVALRGLGGYQLLVNATDQAAVERLRQRKGRRGKPLAVMVESLAAAQQLAEIDATESEALSDPSAPIVLVRARPDSGLAADIHPHLDTVGLMLPTTPLHALLLRDFGGPLVCTSGNREGEPLDYEVDTAEQNLSGIADAWLHHNRDIARPIDDSVVRVIAGRRVTIRLARGLAPLPLALPEMTPTLAVGGFLKAAVAWSNGAQSVLGPHIGDQETLAARQRCLAHFDDWQALFRFQPAEIVRDMHPEYFSTQWAESQEQPTIAAQHHHAHVASAMLEHGWLDRTVLGVSWDGTGFGTDDTIWGGEFLTCTATSFERAARLRPFRLPGGEAAIHQPWRTAVSMCQQLTKPPQAGDWPGWNVSEDQISSIRQIADQPQFSPLTSSAGRLFDAAAAIILGVSHVEFDGQAAMRLEAIADQTATGCYEIPLREGELPELDWRPMFAQLLDDTRRGVAPSSLAMRLHRSLAQAIVEVCRSQADLPVVLTGGVFQNRLLTELVAQMWGDSPQPLGLPGVIPPNDGGLAAGQLAIAAAKGSAGP